MSEPRAGDRNANSGEPEFRWSVFRASDEIENEALVTTIINVKWGPQNLHEEQSLSIQLYETPSGARWIRLWNDQDRAIPYEDFARALRMAESDLGWTDNDDAEHA